MAGRGVCQAERRADGVREELLARCRAERIEPPSAGRCDLIIRSALHQAEQALTRRVTARLGPDEIADATFAARYQAIWGAGSTAVATERHARYGGRGVLIYWHVERKSMAILSQLIGCSASEVAAMIEGVMRHGTTMEVDASYTDSHGQSEIGFGIIRLLGFDLLPRIKRINKTRLSRPAAGDPGA